MPGIVNWVSDPHSLIQTLFESDKANHTNAVQEYFAGRCAERLNYLQIPSLNDVALHSLCSNTLVRYRCMIQDMFDPEFYLGVYEVKDVKTGQCRLINGKYKDLAENRPTEQIQLDSANNVTLDRSTLYCVPVPGEHDWVKQGYAKMSGTPDQAVASTSSGSLRVKRSHEDDTEEVLQTEAASMDTDTTTFGSGSCMGEGSNGDTKRPKAENQNQGASSPHTPDLNFPLPDETGTPCIVKMYDNGDSVKLNEVYEFIGILSNDPAMVTFPEENKASGEISDGVQDSIINPGSDLMEGVEEQKARSPPPSLVPRLHVILANKLQHNNPHLPVKISIEEENKDLSTLLCEAEKTRSELLSLLTSALLGDALTAEFLLCHLLSYVYAREDVMALGKYALNIKGCPRDSNYAKLLYQLLSTLVTKSYLLEMSLSKMNKKAFCPKKDYMANRLQSGILQLSDQTQLVVDETALQPGQLDATGVYNITALGNLVQWQKVEYDFSFHKQDFHSNINVLVLSEGRSLIQCDGVVTLTPMTPTSDLDDLFKSLHCKLDETNLTTRFRNYITLIKLLPYSLSADVQEGIQEDFVQMRKDDPKNISVEGFHAMLVLGRVLCLSHGKTSLTKEMWHAARDLELRRTLRMSAAVTAPSS